MKAPQHFHTLKQLCLPRIESYQGDLLKHDRRAIRRHPKTPFLHLTRDYGTYITMLIPAEDYPPQGVEIPYLFGHADRWHLLKEIGTHMAYGAKNHPNALLHHFDGHILRRITYAQADEILRLYVQKITAAFRNLKLQAA